jgi:hypothetical protein
MAENMIKFLRGNVASLPQTATAGAVYFTKDEGLYLGLEDGTYHRYGDFIIVANVAALPASGAHETCMYYCESENILAKWDGEKKDWIQINKQQTLAQLGGVAESVYNAKIAALEQADTNMATDITNLTGYVGTFTHDTAKSVIEYIDAKTEGIASDAALSDLTGRVTQAEKDIDAIEASLATGGATANAIAAAKAAGDNAQADVDALELKVGTVAEGKTVSGLIKDAQDAADAAQADVDALELKVGDIEEGKTVAGLIKAAQDQADKGVADAATAQAKADSAYTLADGKATMDEVNAAIAGAGHAVKADVDTAIENLDKAYKAADEALETKLQGNIDKKVEKSDYDTQVAALVGEDARIAGLVSAMDEAYKKADSDIVERIVDLESEITGLSGAMHFKGIVDALPETTEGYANGDVVVCGQKEYVVNGENFVELGDVSAEVQRISDLEGVVGKAAKGEEPATGLVKAVAENTAAIAAEKARAEAKEAELVAADATNLKAAKDYADEKIADLKIGDYAKQADLDTHTGDADIHITAAERTAWSAAEQNAKDYADGLNDNMNARVEALEAIDHEHANKALLDTYTQTEANLADAVAKKHEHANAAELAKIADGDVAKWNATEQNAKDYTDAHVAAAKTDASNKDAVVLAEAQKAVTAAKTELQTALDTYKTSNDALVAGKADKATTLAGYGITDAMTADAINALFQWGSF